MFGQIAAAQWRLTGRFVGCGRPGLATRIGLKQRALANSNITAVATRIGLRKGRLAAGKSSARLAAKQLAGRPALERGRPSPYPWILTSHKQRPALHKGGRQKTKQEEKLDEDRFDHRGLARDWRGHGEKLCKGRLRRGRQLQPERTCGKGAGQRAGARRSCGGLLSGGCGKQRAGAADDGRGEPGARHSFGACQQRGHFGHGAFHRPWRRRLAQAVGGQCERRNLLQPRRAARHGAPGRGRDFKPLLHVGAGGRLV